MSEEELSDGATLIVQNCLDGLQSSTVVLRSYCDTRNASVHVSRLNVFWKAGGWLLAIIRVHGWRVVAYCNSGRSESEFQFIF